MSCFPSGFARLSLMNALPKSFEKNSIRLAAFWYDHTICMVNWMDVCNRSVVIQFLCLSSTFYAACASQFSTPMQITTDCEAPITPCTICSDVRQVLLQEGLLHWVEDALSTIYLTKEENHRRLDGKDSQLVPEGKPRTRKSWATQMRIGHWMRLNESNDSWCIDVSWCQ